MWLCGLVFKLFFSSTLAYNLDVNNAIIFNIPQEFQGGRNSYFGYATALYPTSTNDSAILIGAPRANASYLQSVLEPGVVYSCSLKKVCKEWIIGKSENEKHNNPIINDNYQIKNNSWIGAVIETENKTDSSILVCAPRWTNAYYYKWYLNGICYWIEADDIKSYDKKTVNPMFTSKLQQNQIAWTLPITNDLAYSQVGFSAHVSSNGLDSYIALGAPGVLRWTGASVLLNISLHDKMTTNVPHIQGKVSFYENGYFGYSLTSGCYFKKGEYLFASGAPRNHNMYGHVVIYDFPKVSGQHLQIKAIKVGQQSGEYFGAALASCDVNNDGKDDLIVGAPFWSKDMDEGRVYVLFALENKRMKDFTVQIIEGKISGGRFGSTVTCLGDIDYDGYSDIIIGAPYEKDTGAIYLYNGNKNGISNKYSQKILGSQFFPNIRGFGISISKPQDINGDKYPDIAVGAYLSEQVVLLTSKPVISITVNLKQTIKKLLRDTKPFQIKICTIYSGAYAPKEIDIVQILEIDALYGRAVGAISNKIIYNSTYILPATLNIATHQCKEVTIRLKDNIQNVIDPISISVTVDLNYTVQVKNNNSTNNISHTYAVINKLHSKLEDSIELPFVIECGEDNICHSDLQIFLQTNLKSNNTYIIGSTSNLKLTIDVYNKGEPAYQSQVHIFIPEPFLLASIPSTCMESPWINNTLEVVCNVGNPLRSNETVTLELDTSKVHFNVKHLDLYINVTTQSEEKNQLDNASNMRVYFDIDVDIAIAGKAQENLYSYFQKDEKDEKYPQNIRFQHIYEVQTFGASPINEANLTVEIPTRWKSDTYDMELISIEQIIAHKDGHLLQCSNSNHSNIIETPTIPTIKELDIKNRSVRSLPNIVKTNEVEDKVTSIEIPTNIPPENRTLFINCTNPMILCEKIQCELSSLTSSSVAKLTLKLDLKISNVLLLTLDSKDIIYFTSRGTVNIIQPPNITQGSTNKPDTTIIATTFLGAPVAEHVAGWILAVSIFLGILLLILFIIILLKIGFFNRKRKEELKALKAMSNEKNRPVLEPSSSEIDINQE